MKRILVTGAGGFVGARIMEQLMGPAIEFLPFPPGRMAGISREELCELVLHLQPNALIHTAALSDTGYCETHPEESYRANVSIPLWIAEAAREVNAKLVALSSDQVYAGLQDTGPFEEDFSLHPANVYGRHKLEAEQRVLELLPSAVLLRATWMYDLPGYGLPIRGNLILNLLRAALHNEPLRFSCRDYRGVTYVRQAVENLLPALELPGGVYNFGCENDYDMYTTARHFCTVLGITPPLEKADWSRSLRMDCRKARETGIVFDSTFDNVTRCLQDYGVSPLL